MLLNPTPWGNKYPLGTMFINPSQTKCKENANGGTYVGGASRPSRRCLHPLAFSLHFVWLGLINMVQGGIYPPNVEVKTILNY